MAVRYEVHDVLFEVRTGATDDTHFILPDHFSQAEPQFCGTHRSCERDHHLATFIEMSDIAFGGIDERGSIEMAVMMENEFSDGFLAHVRIISGLKNVPQK